MPSIETNVIDDNFQTECLCRRAPITKAYHPSLGWNLEKGPKSGRIVLTDQDNEFTSFGLPKLANYFERTIKMETTQTTAVAKRRFVFRADFIKPRKYKGEGNQSADVSSRSSRKSS